ncbi:molybdopterin-dependent oxidoreductase [Alteromonadaceae bacterium BrNp21-10]|nr:molybdopterin-dependent oxidoreductase [Alteromonadaceae bacterium BrNp21-10]
MPTMPTTCSISRRSFVKLVATSAGLMVSGLSISMPEATPEQHNGDKLDAEFKLFTLHSDNSITLFCPRSEMGQGVMTSMAQLLLEELDADWSQIKQVQHAWADFDRFGAQDTIGAISSFIGWESHRQAGAAVKLLLRQTAAEHWQTDINNVSTDKGQIKNQQSQQTLTYGQLTTLLQGKDLPEKIALKSPEEFKLIGHSMPRLDIADKLSGKAIFGIDQQLANMKIATVQRCPVFAGKLVSFDAKEALKIKGVRDIFAVPSGVAVIADNYWQAQKARKLLNIHWDEGEFSHQSSNTLMQKFAEQLNSQGNKITDIGDVQSRFDADNAVHVEDFHFPLVAHVTMEPMNCTVWRQQHHCEIWAPTQNPQDAKRSAAKALKLEEAKVRVNVTFLGGGFGRRAQDDFVIEACEIAKNLDYPIKLIWSREDDLQHDYYRPLNRQRITASLKDGKIVAWQHKVATLSTAPYHFSLGARHKEDGDWVAYGGSEESLYQIPNFQTQTHLAKTPLTVGILRGISHGYVNFASEVTMDELAQGANIAPIDFRLQHINEPRAQIVLTTLKDKISQYQNGTEGQIDSHVGIAFGHEKSQGDYQYYNAAAALVCNTPQGLKLCKVILVLDHGQVINPDGLKAQAQGSLMYALSMMLQKQIDLDHGRIQQSNFHDYPVARMGEEVDVELHSIGNHKWPMGTGEKLQGTLQPAIANALSKASGTRIRSIPINLATLKA